MLLVWVASGKRLDSIHSALIKSKNLEFQTHDALNFVSLALVQWFFTAFSIVFCHSPICVDDFENEQHDIHVDMTNDKSPADGTMNEKAIEILTRDNEHISCSAIRWDCDIFQMTKSRWKKLFFFSVANWNRTKERNKSFFDENRCWKWVAEGRTETCFKINGMTIKWSFYANEKPKNCRRRNFDRKMY